MESFELILEGNSLIVGVKGVVNPKMKMLLLFTLLMLFQTHGTLVNLLITNYEILMKSEDN